MVFILWMRDIDGGTAGAVVFSSPDGGIGLDVDPRF
jgi:hypothetical protein